MDAMDEVVETYEMPTEIVYEVTEGNVRNYLEISVEDGGDNASLYFEGMNDDGQIGIGYQYLNVDELRALVEAAERALETVEGNS